MMKKILSMLLVIAMTAALTACGSGGSSSSNSKSSVTASTGSTISDRTYTGAVPEKPAFTEVGSNGSRTADEVGFQFDLPAVGDEIVVFHTTMGDIKARLFPDSAPIAVTNFKALVESGYYDGITFHRVIEDFMIQGGDPKGTGTGGESVWGTGFEVESNDNLRHYVGALSMANTGYANSNGSQFFIVQGTTVTSSALSGSKYASMSDAAKALYYEHGGYYSLDGSYSVFGQVFDGMDVVDEIAAVATNSSDKPLTDVVITSAEIVKYEG